MWKTVPICSYDVRTQKQVKLFLLCFVSDKAINKIELSVATKLVRLYKWIVLHGFIFVIELIVSQLHCCASSDIYLLLAIALTYYFPHTHTPCFPLGPAISTVSYYHHSLIIMPLPTISSIVLCSLIRHDTNWIRKWQHWHWTSTTCSFPPCAHHSNEQMNLSSNSDHGSEMTKHCTTALTSSPSLMNPRNFDGYNSKFDGVPSSFKISL